MARKKKPEEPANHERWLVSYADFITLLFAFFVVMYSVSEIDKRKMVEVSESVQFAFGIEGNDRTASVNAYAEGGGSPLSDVRDPLAKEGNLLPEKERVELEGVQTRIEVQLSPLSQSGGLPDGVRLELTDRGLLIRLSEINFFDAGGAMLRPEALPILDAIGGCIAGTKRKVRVQGHSDDQRVGRASDYASNWELAAIRAVSVVRYFHEATKIAPDSLAVSTFGQYQPIADNRTPEGRARNRRIDILVEPT